MPFLAEEEISGRGIPWEKIADMSPTGHSTTFLSSPYVPFMQVLGYGINENGFGSSGGNRGNFVLIHNFNICDPNPCFPWKIPNKCDDCKFRLCHDYPNFGLPPPNNSVIVPEPASIISMTIGALLISGFAWFYRRKSP